MPIAASVWPSSPMSARPNTCQIVPTTFQGISSGSAIRIRQTGTPMPFLGIDSAMKIPSGTSMASTMAENARFLSSASWKRLEDSRSVEPLGAGPEELVVRRRCPAANS